MERRQKIKGAMEVSTKRKTNNECPYSGETEYWVITEKKGKEKQVSRDSSLVCVGMDSSSAAEMLTGAGSDGMWSGGGSSVAAPEETGSTGPNKGGKNPRVLGALTMQFARLDANMLLHCCHSSALQLGC